MNNVHLAVQFFLQLGVILVFCRIIGAIAARFGQPQVVAEMVAGVLLGPSLFGLLLPEAQQWLFPWDKTQTLRDTQSYLFPASQLGLALYMFVVGMEFRVDIVQRRLKSSIGIPNREALGVGTLMNARGLMELIIINLGLQRGIISPALFAVLVIMAVVTTLMASPIFDRLVGSGSAGPIPEPDENETLQPTH
jgi:Kef-type K+ transport system membrane component KefB